MKLHKFLTLCNNYDSLVQFLIEQKVVRDTMNCIKCKKQLILDREKLKFTCNSASYVKNRNKKKIKTQCAVKIRAFRNTWFEHIHLPIQTVCLFIAYHIMLRPPRQQFIMHELNISSSTAVDWASFCRELCTLWVEQHSVQVGGEGTVVEIDEVKIGKRKYNKGRLVTGQWIFGGIERTSKNVFIQPVEDRTAETLLAVIKKWIKPGTTIISGAWKSYNCLNSQGYKHLIVNHAMNFVDPDTGAHTQNIERAWRDTRANIPRYGNRSYHYVGYISEFLFRRQHNYENRIMAFFTVMAKMFPASN